MRVRDQLTQDRTDRTAQNRLVQSRLYLYVKALSDLGSIMDMIVLTAVIFSATHSTGWLAASLAIRTFGGLASSLSSGALADKRDRRKIMIVSDWVRALSILALIVYPTPVAILVVSFVIGFMTSYFGVSFSAEVPHMFGEERVLETNALISRLSSIGMVLGFVGAGVIQSWLGFRVVLGLDALSYVTSAIVLMRFRWNRSTPDAAQSRHDLPPGANHGLPPGVRHGHLPGVRQGVFRSLLSDMAEVKGYLWVKPLFLVIFVGYFVETFGASSHNVGIPLLAAQLSAGQQALYYGLIWGVWGVGNVLSTSLLPRWSRIRDHLFLSYWVSTLCMSAGFITFLSTTSLWIVFPFAFLTGIFDAASGTLFATIMQMTTDTIRGRIFGVSTFLNRLGFGIGFVVAPLLLRHMPMPHMVWLLHGTVITITLLSIFVARRIAVRSNYMDDPTNASFG
jgi:MFS family permease